MYDILIGIKHDKKNFGSIVQMSNIRYSKQKPRDSATAAIQNERNYYK